MSNETFWDQSCDEGFLNDGEFEEVIDEKMTNLCESTRHFNYDHDYDHSLNQNRFV